MLADNSRSALAKVVMFQYDGGNLVKDDLCASCFTHLLPLTNDADEAQDIHSIILKQAIAKNEVLMKNGDAVKGMVAKLQAH
jgi:hypothetical protein